MTKDCLKFDLSQSSASEEARNFLTFLQEASLKPVVVSVLGVQRLHFLVLEILVAGKLQWQSDQIAFQIEGANTSFLQYLADLGLSETFEIELEL